MTNNTSSVRFHYDFINKTIYGTKASFDKASKGFGPAYEELAAKMAEHPDFTCDVKELKKRTTERKETYDGMSIEWMRAYIAMKNDEKFSKHFEQVIRFAKNSKRSPYPLAKKFFLKEFTDENGVVQFNYAKAREQVEAYLVKNTPAENTANLAQVANF